MPSILGSATVTFIVLTTLFAGDAVRHALTVPVWAGLVLAGVVWAVTVLWSHSVSWRSLPGPLLLVLGWWAITPGWSSYPGTSLLMLLAAVVAILIASALVSVLPSELLVRRLAFAIRLVLVGSLVFEIGVAVSGAPLFPVGVSVTESTPIEVAWSRAQFFTAGARIQGLVGNANLLGMLALVALIIAGWRFVVDRPSRTRSLGDAVVAIVVIARTMSATVTVALVALLVVVGLIALARRRGTGWRIVLGVALAGILGAIGVVIAQWPHVAALLGKSPDMTHRFDIWRSVWTRIIEQPIVGHGFVGWWPSWDPWFQIQIVNGLPMSQAHNLWLDLAMQTGIIGVALFAVALGWTLWILWRRCVESPASPTTVAFLVLVALTVQSLTESRLLHEWGLATFVACAIIAHRVRRRA